jgi:hypothetical protein
LSKVDTFCDMMDEIGHEKLFCLAQRMAAACKGSVEEWAMGNRILRTFFATLLVAAAILAGRTYASVEGQLTGDSRPTNPDDLIVDVSVTFDDANDTTAEWLIDINSPAHPTIKLQTFVFNLLLDLGSDWTDVIAFSGFSPSGWAVDSPGDPVGGGFGSVNFNFEAIDPPGPPPHAADVTNSQSLSFTATLLDGSFWSNSMFTGAASLTGDAGTGQMGAHLLSLGLDGEASGFALGDYEVVTPGEPVVVGPVPEATTIAMWLGLAGVFGVRMRKRLPKA